ncbi:MAG: hypothetical protein V4489_09285 [Chlamydiota bacterium]
MILAGPNISNFVKMEHSHSSEIKHDGKNLLKDLEKIRQTIDKMANGIIGDVKDKKSLNFEKVKSDFTNISNRVESLVLDLIHEEAPKDLIEKASALENLLKIELKSIKNSSKCLKKINLLSRSVDFVYKDFKV